MAGVIAGLYVITDSAQQAVADAIRGGAQVVQYRDKSADTVRRKEAADALARLCRGAGVCFIVNDDVALAAAVGADGVHLGQDDSSVAAARAQLGSRAIVGVSCYNSLERAADAVAAGADYAGADYVAFGSVYPSPTKPQAVRAPLSLFAEARALTDRPLVAIGGINATNAAAVRAAGADAVAVIDGVFGADNVEAAAAAIAKQFND
ncbi:thiamine phosphate synthase [Spiribacter sp. C176]|uniref:Thiamine-phosphate synthase n=1 Tax=Spiribacter salilacus TaxID=2664894 RepID=A0A6N7QQZ1_9GAMM|nr:thiamine phosphate synthase [Spiribacter salilacus]MRH78935.1 thiamine phosphate synthase [Spiribacter salilacus]